MRPHAHPAHKAYVPGAILLRQSTLLALLCGNPPSGIAHAIHARATVGSFLPHLLEGCILQGAGSMNTWLMRTAPNGYGIIGLPHRNTNEIGWTEGANHNSSGGKSCQVEGVGLMTMAPNNISAIMIASDGNFAPDSVVLRDIRISRDDGINKWNHGVHINGASRLTPDGVREAVLEHVRVFANHDWAFVISYVQGAYLSNCHNVGGDATKYNGKARSVYAAGVQGREIQDLDIKAKAFD